MGHDDMKQKIEELEVQLSQKTEHLEGLIEQVGMERNRMNQLDENIRNREATKSSVVVDENYHKTTEMTASLLLKISKSLLQHDSSKENSELLNDDIVIVQVTMDSINRNRRTALEFSRNIKMRSFLNKICDLWALQQDHITMHFEGCLISEEMTLAELTANSNMKSIKIRLKESILSASDSSSPDASARVTDPLLHRSVENLTNKPYFHASVIRDFLLYLILFICFIISFWDSRTMSRWLGYSSHNLYSGPVSLVATLGNEKIRFDNIRTNLQLETWVYQILLPFIDSDLLGLVTDCNTQKYWSPYPNISEMVGLPQFMQYRVTANASCTVPRVALENFSECYSLYQDENRDVLTFGVPGQEFTKGFYWSAPNSFADSLLITPTKLVSNYFSTAYTTGYLSTYPTVAGYEYLIGESYRISGNFCQVNTSAVDFYDNVFTSWLDAATSAVMVSFNLLIGGSEVILTSQYLFEFGLNGRIIPSFRYATVPINFKWNFGAADYVCAVILSMILVRNLFIIKKSIEIKTLSMYVLSLEPWIDTAVLAFFIVTWVLVFRTSRLASDLSAMSLTNNAKFIPLMPLANEMMKVEWSTLILCSLLGIRLLGIIQLHRMGVYINTVLKSLCWQSLTGSLYLLYPVLGYTLVLVVSFPSYFIDVLNYWTMVMNILFRDPSTITTLLSPQSNQPSLYIAVLVCLTFFVSGFLIQAAIFGSARWVFDDVRRTMGHERKHPVTWDSRYLKDVFVAVFNPKEAVRNRELEKEGKKKKKKI